jgi:hypothetical protein
MEQIKVLINALSLAARADTVVRVVEGDRVVRILNEHLTKETEEDHQKAYENLIAAIRQDQYEGTKLTTPVVEDRQVSDLVNDLIEAASTAKIFGNDTAKHKLTLAKAALLHAISVREPQPTVQDDDTRTFQELLLLACQAHTAWVEAAGADRQATLYDEARRAVSERYRLVREVTLNPAPGQEIAPFDALLNNMAVSLRSLIRAEDQGEVVHHRANLCFMADRDAVRGRYAGLDKPDPTLVREAIGVLVRASRDAAFAYTKRLDSALARQRAEEAEKHQSGAREALLKLLGLHATISMRDIATNTITAEQIVVGTVEPVVPRRTQAYRVGHKVPRHVYRGDEPLFTAATPELAHELVRTLNGDPKHRQALIQALVLQTVLDELMLDTAAYTGRGTLPGGVLLIDVLHRVRIAHVGMATALKEVHL